VISEAVNEVGKDWVLVGIVAVDSNSAQVVVGFAGWARRVCGVAAEEKTVLVASRIAYHYFALEGRGNFVIVG